jgi:hypothetical protein
MPEQAVQSSRLWSLRSSTRSALALRLRRERSALSCANGRRRLRPAAVCAAYGILAYTPVRSLSSAAPSRHSRSFPVPDALSRRSGPLIRAALRQRRHGAAYAAWAAQSTGARSTPACSAARGDLQHQARGSLRLNVGAAAADGQLRRLRGLGAVDWWSRAASEGGRRRGRRLERCAHGSRPRRLSEGKAVEERTCARRA